MYKNIDRLHLSHIFTMLSQNIYVKIWNVSKRERRSKFRFRRRSDTCENVGHLIFLRHQVFASNGNSFESTVIHVTPNIPLCTYNLLCTSFDNVFDQVKTEDILEAAISDLKATFFDQENTKELISRVEEIFPSESQKYEVVNVTENDVRFKATMKTTFLKDEDDIENFRKL